MARLVEKVLSSFWQNISLMELMNVMEANFVAFCYYYFKFFGNRNAEVLTGWLLLLPLPSEWFQRICQCSDRHLNINGNWKDKNDKQFISVILVPYIKYRKTFFWSLVLNLRENCLKRWYPSCTIQKGCYITWHCPDQGIKAD